MQQQQQPLCNRSEIEEAVRLLMGFPGSPYVRHPTLFVNSDSKEEEKEKEEKEGVNKEKEEEDSIAPITCKTPTTSNCDGSSTYICAAFFSEWMRGRAIDVGSPCAVVLQSLPLKNLIDHCRNNTDSAKSTHINAKLGQVSVSVQESTLVFKCYRPSGVHKSAIPLGERSVYLCAKRTIQRFQEYTARTMFPQLFLPLFVTTIDSVDVRDDSSSSGSHSGSSSTKKRKKSAISAAVRLLKPSASAPDINTIDTPAPTMSEQAHIAGSWPNLVRAETTMCGEGPSTLLNPPSAPPPNTVVMTKYCGSLADLIPIQPWQRQQHGDGEHQRSPLSPAMFISSFEDYGKASADPYCRVLSRQPILNLKLLTSLLYLITRGLVQIHNLTHGYHTKKPSKEEDEEENDENEPSPPEHLTGFVHNDLRLPNILLARDGNVGLVDFELATPIVLQRGLHVLADKHKWEKEVGHHEKFVGHAYLPPDGIPCDVWTLGIVALDLITGCHTFFSGDGHLPPDSLRWSDGPTPIKAEANRRLAILSEAVRTTKNDASLTPNSSTIVKDITTIDDYAPLSDFLSACFSPDAATRLQSLQHTNERKKCSGKCLSSHDLFSSVLKTTDGTNMEDEAKRCIQKHFMAAAILPSISSPTTPQPA